MAKKKAVKRTAQKRAVKRKAATTLKPKGPTLQDKEFLKRVADLGLNLTPLMDDFLALLLELDRKHKPGPMAILNQMARQAYYKAAKESDDPAKWLKAARKATQLD